MITQKRLREVLAYDEKTGVFRWAKDRPKVKAGKIAGGINGKGYRLMQVDGITYSAHRLAWLYVYGSFPENQIDHVNGDRDDNRLCNLRDVTNRVNHQNQACHRNGKLVGVSWRKKDKEWGAQIWVNGKNMNLGYYDTEQEGHEAYLEALGELQEVRG